MVQTILPVLQLFFGEEAAKLFPKRTRKVIVIIVLVLYLLITLAQAFLTFANQ